MRGLGAFCDPTMRRTKFDYILARPRATGVCDHSLKISLITVEPYYMVARSHGRT